jgi:hypothetical protein
MTESCLAILTYEKNPNLRILSSSIHAFHCDSTSASPILSLFGCTGCTFRCSARLRRVIVARPFLKTSVISIRRRSPLVPMPTLLRCIVWASQSSRALVLSASICGRESVNSHFAGHVSSNPGVRCQETLEVLTTSWMALLSTSWSVFAHVSACGILEYLDPTAATAKTKGHCDTLFVAKVGLCSRGNLG